jgi:CII-binding regulator of phage lambda lysogenization HflD
MENKKEEIEKLLIKLKVLENRIHYLETLTDEIMNEVASAYHEQIKELHQKKEEAQQKLLKIKEAGDDR